MIELAVIEVCGLTKYYGDIRGIEDLHLDVEEGEIFGYLGPNGSEDMRVERIILFGSRATGTGHRDSDLDLIIVSPDFQGTNYFDRAAMMHDHWDSALPVDFLCYTPSEFGSLSQQATIVREAVKTGIEA